MMIFIISITAALCLTQRVSSQMMQQMPFPGFPMSFQMPPMQGQLPPSMPPGMAGLIPPGMPGLMPPGMGGPMLPGMRGQMPPGIGGPMPLHMPMGFPQQKLPLVVMPFYKNGKKKSSKKKHHKKRRHIRKKIHQDSESSSESCDSSDTSSSSDHSYKSGRRAYGSKKRKNSVLTPVVSYVTKNGYVVYRKKIKNERAKDWLEMEKHDFDNDSGDEIDGGHITVYDLKQQISNRFSNRKRNLL